MNVHQVSDCYARALLAVEGSEEQEEKRESDLQGIVRLIINSKDFKRFFDEPQIKVEEKKEVLKNALHGKIDQMILNFLFLLLDKGRFKLLPTIARHYHRMLVGKYGAIEARVISAIPLDDATKDRIKIRLEAAFGKKFKIRDKVNPTIIGGILVKVGNQIADCTIREGIADLKDALSMRSTGKVIG